MIDRAKQFIKYSGGIIFDLDGLIIDSEPIWGQTRIAMVNKYGDPKTAHLKAGTTGMGLWETIEIHKKLYKLKGKTEDLMDKYRETLYEILFQDGNLFFMPGALEFLQTLTGRPIALATGGHTPEMIQEILGRLGIQQYFSATVSCDEVEEGKPEPDVYIEAARRLGKETGHTIIFEDAANGVLAGKKSGAIVIGVNKDKVIQEALQDAGADVVVGSLADLI